MLTHGGVNQSATLEAQAGSGGPFGVFSRGSAPSPFAFPFCLPLCSSSAGEWRLLHQPPYQSPGVAGGGPLCGGIH